MSLEIHQLPNCNFKMFSLLFPKLEYMTGLSHTKVTWLLLYFKLLGFETFLSFRMLPVLLIFHHIKMRRVNCLVLMCGILFPFDFP